MITALETHYAHLPPSDEVLDILETAMNGISKALDSTGKYGPFSSLEIRIGHRAKDSETIFLWERR